MKVEINSLTEKEQERRDYGNALQIKFDDLCVFQVYDGETEDSTLNRNFNDCWKIIDLIEKAHRVGLAGENLEIINNEVEAL